ncbi:MAG TPA: hypothetical protein VFJ16_00475 [Longimicrobium sp.]|nr:hypothetical protein [Longimicrobium sp.]
MPIFTPPPRPSGPPPADAGEPVRIELSYRVMNAELPPRRVKLGIPGWAGEDVPARDGARAQPWHCRPFVDAASYGVELVYGFETECRVTRGEDGAIHFEGDFTAEIERVNRPGQIMSNPFGVFAPHHYGMSAAVDLLPPPGHVLRIEPHPRFFTDETGTVAAAVPGHLERFWPRMFFVVFKAPAPGQTHIFRTGEPFAQVLVVPAQATYSLAEMAPEQVEDRKTQDRQITGLAYLLSKHLWKAENGLYFNDKYKQLLRIFRAGGMDGVREHLRQVAAIARMGDAVKPPERDSNA